MRAHTSAAIILAYVWAYVHQSVPLATLQIEKDSPLHAKQEQKDVITVGSSQKIRLRLVDRSRVCGGGSVLDSLKGIFGRGESICDDSREHFLRIEFCQDITQLQKHSASGGGGGGDEEGAPPPPHPQNALADSCSRVFATGSTFRDLTRAEVSLLNSVVGVVGKQGSGRVEEISVDLTQKVIKVERRHVDCPGVCRPTIELLIQGQRAKLGEEQAGRLQEALTLATEELR